LSSGQDAGTQDEKPGCIRLAADRQGKPTLLSPIVGVKGHRLGLIAFADPRYFGSDQFKQLAVAIRQTECPEGDFVLELPSIHCESIPLHEHPLRHGSRH
jgi:hypothetical protein